jgi:hypothetical protein
VCWCTTSRARPRNRTWVPWSCGTQRGRKKRRMTEARFGDLATKMRWHCLTGCLMLLGCHSGLRSGPIAVSRAGPSHKRNKVQNKKSYTSLVTRQAKRTY